MDTITESVRAEAGAAQSVLGALQDRLGAQKFNAWFGHGTRLSVDDHHVRLTVPNPFVANWIQTHYYDQMVEAVESHLGPSRRVLIDIDPTLSSDLRKRQRDTQAEIVERTNQGRTRRLAGPGQVRLKYRLEDFVVGECNKLAYSAAATMATLGKSPFSPLFIHGSCGLGKTHLLQGICNAVSRLSRRGRPAAWKYVTAEQFTNDFITALREKKIDRFRQRYRRLDVLAIDDVHFLSAKKATQDEFLHTFNALDTAGAHIVLASDAHPRLVGELNAQLVSRFVAGMVVGIRPPGKATRMEMLRRRARSMKLPVPEDVLGYIAEHIRGSVRELEGALIKLAALAALEGGKITSTMATEALADYLARTDSALTLGQIEEVVAGHFGITPADIHSSRRTKTVSAARTVAAFLARRHTRMSYPEIARFMGKNHSSIVSAVKRIEKMLTGGEKLSWMTPAGPKSMSAGKVVELLSERIG